MNAETAQPFPATAPQAGPPVQRAAVPMWVIVLFAMVFYAALLYMDHYAGGFHPLVYEPYRNIEELAYYQPATGEEGFIRQGQVVYEKTCALCHKENGLGLPAQYPPLAGAEWVTGSPGRLIRIPLQGVAGPMTVSGEQWNHSMPAMGAALSDEDLAAALTYIRQAWGNNAPPITPEQVQVIRQATAGRIAPWTAAELQPISD